ncbi:MAG: response regulator transcription factor [Chitinophagaceae bacterium]|nr:response regulator transcription factor [Chitinophagaceae bacterium]
MLSVTSIASPSVLVYETDAAIRDVLKEFFKLMKLRAILCEMAHQVQETAERMQPRLALLDYHPLDKVAHKLSLKLRSSSLTKHLPIIVLSTFPDLEHIKDSVDCDMLMAKPFDMYTLKNALLRFLKR